MAMEKIKVRLKRTKETPGTIVYGTDNKDAAVTQLYVKKTAFPDGQPPKFIKLLVSDAGGD